MREVNYMKSSSSQYIHISMSLTDRASFSTSAWLKPPGNSPLPFSFSRGRETLTSSDHSAGRKEACPLRLPRFVCPISFVASSAQ